MNFLYNDPLRKKIRTKLRKSQTDAEKLLWSKLRAKQLCGIKFFRQYSIGNYIVDFYSSQKRLVIEVDGGQHNEIEEKQNDQERTHYFNTLGIKEIRFWNNEVLQNIEGVITAIKNFITPPDLPLS